MTKAKAKGSAGGAATAKPVSGYMKAATAGVGLIGAAALGRSALNQYRDKYGYYSQAAINKRTDKFLLEASRARFEEREREHEARVAAELAEHDRRIAIATARAEAARARANQFQANVQAMNRAEAHARRAHQVPSPQGGVFNLQQQHSGQAILAMLRQRQAEL